MLEREANQFIASLLMPKELIEDCINNVSEDLTYNVQCDLISNKFKVSQQAMDYRLKALGYYDYGF